MALVAYFLLFSQDSVKSLTFNFTIIVLSARRSPNPSGSHEIFTFGKLSFPL